MDNRSSIRTVGMVAGTVILLIVLFLVAGISTGFLPWRDSYAQQPWPTKNVDAIAPTPTATATPTPKPTPTPTPTPATDGETDEEEAEATPTPTPTPEPTPTPTPVPTPGVTLDEELPTYSVTVTFSRGGSAIPYGINSVVENGSMTVVAVPDAGFVVDEMIIDGESYKGITSYVFEDVVCNHTVHISFSRSLFAPTPTPEITPTPVPTPVDE